MQSRISVHVSNFCPSEGATEASRRVGWAKYFEEQDKVEQLKALCECFYDLLRFHDRIPSSDPLLSEASRLIQNVRRI
jgi:hypothetical protein